MKNTKYISQINTLNPAQAQALAVDSLDVPVLVIAGPGTGKTHLLTMRIARILEISDAAPESILALTFTENAAFEMKQRLIELIGTTAYRVPIMTFHGFCQNLITSNPDVFEDLRFSQPVEEYRQIEIIREILSSTRFDRIKPKGDIYHYIKDILSTISQLKREDIGADQFEADLNRDEQDILARDDITHYKGAHKGKMKSEFRKRLDAIEKSSEFSRVYRKYQQSLKQSSYYDYNDMILEVLRRIEADESFRMQIQEQYQYVLVDEHQDTNGAQYKLVDIITGFYEDQRSIFVVGDDKQSIFRFQGASAQNFIRFFEQFPHGHQIQLTDNYRSSQAILDAADMLIRSRLDEDPDLIPVLTAQSKPDTDSNPLLFSCPDTVAQYSAIATMIHKHNEEGIPLEEIAVITRTNRELREVSDYLKALSIPVQYEHARNALDNEYVKRLLMIIRIFSSSATPGDLIKAVSIDVFAVALPDLELLTRHQKENPQATPAAIITDTALLEKAHSPEPLKQAFVLLQSWMEEVRRQPPLPLNYLLIRVLAESGIRDRILSLKDPHEHFDAISSLHSDLNSKYSENPEMTIDEYIRFIDTITDFSIALAQKEPSTRKGAVVLQSAHKAKGKEYQIVYVPNLTDSNWGSARKPKQPFYLPALAGSSDLDEKAIHLEEERRLLFVAMTRAKEQLILMYPTRNLDGREQIPSVFLEQIERTVTSMTLPEEDTNNSAKIQTPLSLRYYPDPHHNAQSSLLETHGEYYRELFRRKGLAPTSYNNYLSCPWKYFFRSLLEIPEEKTPTLQYGTAIHAALSQYIKMSPATKSEKALHRFFENAMNQSSLRLVEKQQFIDKGKESLSKYYQEIITGWDQSCIETSELRIKQIPLSADLHINGAIDLIMHSDDSSRLIIYDFKTGKPKSRNAILGKTANDEPDYYRQLVFYKLLIDRYFQPAKRMETGVLSFVEPTPSGRIKEEYFDIPSEETAALQDDLIRVSNEILEFTFRDSICDDSSCEYCAMRRLMKL